ncbi:MAG: hypothetical protein ABFS39_06180 [Pseudomonadota bacterium]
MKKILSVLLIVLVGILLSACGGGSDDSSSDTTSVQQKIDLSWTAPTTRTDGSSLAPSELEGYRIYYGTSPDDLVLQEEILGISATEISIAVPSSGIYYFAVTAYDSDGLESSFSEVVSKEVS